jgi:hypothetical protein
MMVVVGTINVVWNLYDISCISWKQKRKQAKEEDNKIERMRKRKRRKESLSAHSQQGMKQNQTQRSIFHIIILSSIKCTSNIVL